MKVINTKIKGLKIIQQKNHKDTRGSLREIYRKKIINWDKLVFDFVTTSKKNVLRGFHFQWKCQQVKYVSVIKGKILDCVIDLRKSSKTFGKTFSIVLSEKNCLSLYIPEGFAHGYLVTSSESIVIYKCTDIYDPNDQFGIIWNDETIGVDWTYDSPILSEKDLMLPALNDQQFLPEY